MSFIIQCDNKGCFEYQEALLNAETNEVICVNCGKSISSVTQFTKTAMKGIGQILRNHTYKKAFAIECYHCGKKDQPVLVNNDVSCPHCINIHANLSKPFKQTLVQFLKSKL